VSTIRQISYKVNFIQITVKKNYVSACDSWHQIKVFNLQLFILIEQMVKYFQTLMFLCFCVCRTDIALKNVNVSSKQMTAVVFCGAFLLSINTWSILSALINSDIVCKNNRICVTEIQI